MKATPLKAGTIVGSIIVLLLCVSLWAQANEREGLSVYSASTDIQDDMYYLDAQLEYELSETALEALENGVALTFEMEVEIYRPRKWWWGETLTNIVQQYQVVYHALTRQYIITNLNSGVQNSYANRKTALLTMGRIIDFPLVAHNEIPKDGQYRGRLRIALLISELPAPMRPWAYISSSWRLKSEWFEWEIQ